MISLLISGLLTNDVLVDSKKRDECCSVYSPVSTRALWFQLLTDSLFVEAGADDECRAKQQMLPAVSHITGDLHTF